MTEETEIVAVRMVRGKELAFAAIHLDRQIIETIRSIYGLPDSMAVLAEEGDPATLEEDNTQEQGSFLIQRPGGNYYQKKTGPGIRFSETGLRSMLDFESEYQVQQVKPQELSTVLQCLEQGIRDFERMGIKELNYFVKEAKDVYDLGSRVLASQNNSEGLKDQKDN